MGSTFKATKGADSLGQLLKMVQLLPLKISHSPYGYVDVL